MNRNPIDGIADGDRRHDTPVTGEIGDVDYLVVRAWFLTKPIGKNIWWNLAGKFLDPNILAIHLQPDGVTRLKPRDCRIDVNRCFVSARERGTHQDANRQWQ